MGTGPPPPPPPPLATQGRPGQDTPFVRQQQQQQHQNQHNQQHSAHPTTIQHAQSRSHAQQHHRHSHPYRHHRDNGRHSYQRRDHHRHGPSRQDTHGRRRHGPSHRDHQVSQQATSFSGHQERQIRGGRGRFRPHFATTPRYQFPQQLPAVIKVESPELPIDAFRQIVLDRLKTHQTIILRGHTGSGKTTRIPQFILKDCQAQGKACRIICTQPRRVAAINIAKRVAAEHGSPIGQTIGYRVSREHEAGSDCLCTFVTTGILEQHLLHEKKLDTYTHIIIDEVHERDVLTDTVLFLVRSLLPRYPDVKVVLMSATMDCDPVANYFSVPTLNQQELVQRSIVPIVDVGGKLYPVEIFYLDDVLHRSDAMESYYFERSGTAGIETEISQVALQLIHDIHDREQRAIHTAAKSTYGGVLVFLPGLGEIDEFYQVLEESLNASQLQHEFVLIPCHSTLEQAGMFEETPGRQKIILATNIAESSITLPDIVYVIDFCLVKELWGDENEANDVASLRLQWASQASCQQRSGRAGRVTCGQAYRLVSRAFYHDFMKPYAIPEMQRLPMENIMSLILRLKILHAGDPAQLLSDTLQPPSGILVQHALRRLVESGALSTQVTGETMDLSGKCVYDGTGRLTALGKIFAELPVTIHISRLLIFGLAFDLWYEALVMAACLTLQGSGIFDKPFHYCYDAYRAKYLASEAVFSDPIVSLKVYHTWQFMRQSGKWRHAQEELTWCRDAHVQLKKLKEVERTIVDLSRRVKSLGITIPSTRFNDGYYKRFLVYDGRSRKRRQQAERYGKSVNIHDNIHQKEFDEHHYLLLKILLCAAFFPNYAHSSPKDLSTNIAQRISCAQGKETNTKEYRTVILHGHFSNELKDTFKHMLNQFGPVEEIEITKDSVKIIFMDVEPSKNDQEEEPQVYDIDTIPRATNESHAKGFKGISDVPRAIPLMLKYWEVQRRLSYRQRNREDRQAFMHVLDEVEFEERDDDAPSSFTIRSISSIHELTEYRLDYPFELSFQLFSGHTIYIHPDSLNRHTFQPNPYDAKRHLLVYPYSTRKESTNIMTAHQSTLMPAIPLLIPLICMWFSPQVLFLPNPRKNRFASLEIMSHVVSEGLSSFGKPMSHPFDAIMDVEEIQHINDIRAVLNDILTIKMYQAEKGWSEEALWMKRAMLSILLKPRKKLRKIYSPSRDGVKLDSSFLPSAPGSPGKDDSATLLPPLVPCQLQRLGDGQVDSEEEADQEAKKILKSLEKVMGIPKEKLREPAIVCRQCEEIVGYALKARPLRERDGKLFFQIPAPSGILFTGLKDPRETTCRNDHIVGKVIQNSKLCIASDANVEIKFPDGSTIPYDEKAWEGDFSLVRQRMTMMPVEEERNHRPTFYCELCREDCRTAKNYQAHLITKAHRRRMEEFLYNL